MNTDAHKLGPQIARGALFGAAAWSAYAVVEFFCASVVFRLSRPYAILPNWHWHLTMLVIAGYFFCGILAGALVCLAACFLRTGEGSPGTTEPLATLTLAIALIVNLIADSGLRNGGGVQLVLALLFVALLLLALRSPVWRGRLGWLTNAWVIAIVWLGTGLAYTFRRYYVASQLGKPIDLAVTGIAAGLAAVAVASLFLGRAASRGSSRDAWPMRIGVFSCSSAALLFRRGRGPGLR